MEKQNVQSQIEKNEQKSQIQVNQMIIIEQDSKNVQSLDNSQKIQNKSNTQINISYGNEVTLKKKLRNQFIRRIGKNNQLEMTMSQIYNKQNAQYGIIQYINEKNKICQEYLSSCENQNYSSKQQIDNQIPEAEKSYSQQEKQQIFVSKLEINKEDNQISFECKKDTNNQKQKINQILNKENNQEQKLDNPQPEKTNLEKSELLRNEQHKTELIQKPEEFLKQNFSKQEINSNKIQNLQYQSLGEKPTDLKQQSDQSHEPHSSYFTNQSQEIDGSLPNQISQENTTSKLNLLQQGQKEIDYDNITLKKKMRQILKNNKEANFQEEQSNQQEETPQKIDEKNSWPKLQDSITTNQSYQSQTETQKSNQKEKNFASQYLSQINQILNEIEEYDFSQFKIYDQNQYQNIRLFETDWSKEKFEDVNSNKVQNQVFKDNKETIFKILKEREFYLCKILTSSERASLILGYKEEEIVQEYTDEDGEIQTFKNKVFKSDQDGVDQYIFQIINNQQNSEVELLIQVYQTLQIDLKIIEIEQGNISIYIIEKSSFLTAKENFDLLFEFKNQIQQFEEKYCEINSKDFTNCNECEYEFEDSCIEYQCFENIKSRLLDFMQSNNYVYSHYQNKQTKGIIFEVNKEELLNQYINYSYIFAYQFLESKELEKQKRDQFKQNSDQSAEENIYWLVENLVLISEYQFKEYKTQNKPDINSGELFLNQNNQRQWSIDKFKEVNLNNLSFSFLNGQDSIIQILKIKNYFLCKQIFSNNKNEDIFLGYEEKSKGFYQDYIFIIKYNPSDSEIEKYLLIQKFNEEINHFIINGNINILIMQNDVFVQVYKHFKQLSQIKSEWNEDYFEEINKDKIINQKRCGICQRCKNNEECSELSNIKLFQEQKKIIFRTLVKQNYYICEYLNQGGEGVIFKGYKQTIQQKQDVVFKVLFNCRDDDLENEIKMMKMFDIQMYVIKFIDIIKINDKVHVMVLEKCKFSLKDELEELVSKKKEFPLKKLLQILFNLLDGLIQLRIYYILHLDIKPQNILLTEQDQYVYTDFGISFLKKNNQNVYVKGFSKFYASPEQLEYDKNIDFQSDIYSLGKTFQRILEDFQNLDEGKHKDLINQFKDIVAKKMLVGQSNKRSNCLQLSDEFFQVVLNQDLCYPFLKYYLDQMKIILESYPYDENKEIPYFLQISLYYNKNILSFYQKECNFNPSIDAQGNLQNIALSLDSVGLCYQNLGNNKQALENQLESLKLRKQLFQQNHPEIILSLSNIGSCYKNLGENKKALTYKLESLQMTKQLQSKYNQSTATCLNNVGLCYLSMNNFNKALQYLLKSLQVYQSIFNDKQHPLVANTLSNISSCYENLKNTKKALEYSLGALQMCKQIFKENHVQTAASLNNVGTNFLSLGNNNKALQYLQEALSISKQIYKENHISVVVCMDNIGKSYKNLGDFKNAVEYFENCYKIQLKIYKENHPDILNSINNIAICYQDLGENKKALEYLQKSLEMNKKMYKDNYQSIALSLNNIGAFYQNIGDIKNALQSFLESYQMFNKVFKKNHPDIAIVLNNLGSCYLYLGEYRLAEGFLLSSLKMQKELQQKSDSDMAKCLNNIGQCYQQQGFYQKALDSFIQSIDIQKQTCNGDHPTIASCLQNIGLCYLELGQFQKALDFNLQAYEMLKKLFSQNHREIAPVLESIGLCYQYLGDNQKALQYSEKSLKIIMQICQGDNLKVASCLNTVGSCYQNLGNHQKALDYQLQSLNMHRKLYDKLHINIATQLLNVASCYRNLENHKKALELFLESHQMIKNIYQDNSHPYIELLTKFIAICYKNLGYYQIALEYFLEFLGNSTKISQEELPSMKQMIKTCYDKLNDNQKKIYYVFKKINFV